MGKNKKNDGIQQGAVRRAPGQHGDKTRSRQAEIAHTGERSREPKGPRHDPAEIRAHDTVGKDRLFEDRQQHDEAEKNSEKTRLARDADRHGHTPHDELAERNRTSNAKRKS
jgi:hypothetical protein